MINLKHKSTKPSQHPQGQSHAQHQQDQCQWKTKMPHPRSQTTQDLRPQPLTTRMDRHAPPTTTTSCRPHNSNRDQQQAQCQLVTERTLPALCPQAMITSLIFQFHPPTRASQTSSSLLTTPTPTQLLLSSLASVSSHGLAFQPPHASPMSISQPLGLCLSSPLHIHTVPHLHPPPTNQHPEALCLQPWSSRPQRPLLPSTPTATARPLLLLHHRHPNGNSMNAINS